MLGVQFTNCESDNGRSAALLLSEMSGSVRAVREPPLQTIMQATAKSTFMRGVRDVFPILFGALPFGIVVGVVSAEIGFTALQSIVESSGIFAGAAQLVMLDLLGNDAALWVIVISASILNLRHVIYSASLAPHYKERSTLWKFILSFVMVDQVYALGIAHHTDNPNSPHKHW